MMFIGLMEPTTNAAGEPRVQIEITGPTPELTAFVAVKALTDCGDVLFFNGYPTDVGTFRAQLVWAEGCTDRDGLEALGRKANEILMLQTQVLNRPPATVSTLRQLRAWLGTQRGKWAKVAAGIVAGVVGVLELLWFLA